MSTTKHAILSPSSAYRWMTCPGSAALNYGRDDWNEYSDQGTAAHAMLEWCLKHGKDADQFPDQVIFIGNDGEAYHGSDPLPAGVVARNEFDADDEMRDNIQVVLDEVERQAKGNTVQAEQRITLSDTLGVPDQGGTSDVIVLDEIEFDIQSHDLKYGASPRGIVWAGTPENPNPQLALYGCGALEELDLVSDWRTVTLFVHQPRLNHFDSVQLTVEQLRAFGLSARAAAAEAMTGFDEIEAPITNDVNGPLGLVLVPKSPDELYELGLLRATDDKACNYCAHAADCRALREAAKVSTLDSFDVVTEADQSIDRAEVEEAFDCYPPSPAQVALLERVAAAILTTVRERLKRGDKVKGWKLVRGKKGRRSWIAAMLAKVEEILKDKFRLKSEDMYTKKLKSPTQLEKVLKESPKRWEQVKEYITQNEGGEVLASSDDPREAITHASVRDSFDDLTGDDGSDLT